MLLKKSSKIKIKVKLSKNLNNTKLSGTTSIQIKIDDYVPVQIKKCPCK